MTIRNLKRPFAFSVVILLAACGGSGGGNQVAAQTTQSTSPVATAILAAEASGKLPVLNRDNTLLGVDADGNGVRDDMDAYIDALPDTLAQKKALRQSYKATAASITANLLDEVALAKVGVLLANAVNCTGDVYGSGFWKKTDVTERLTLNTKSRYLANQKFAQAMNGSVITMPNGDTCEK